MAASSRDYRVRRSMCNLPVFKSAYTSECKHAIISLHCKSSLWNMEYVACGGAFERPRIYRTNRYGRLVGQKLQHTYVYKCLHRLVTPITISYMWKQGRDLHVHVRLVNGLKSLGMSDECMGMTRCAHALVLPRKEGS